VEEGVARLGCRNWKVVALNREGWRKLLTFWHRSFTFKF
jgi:hypothetical protein